MNKEGRYNKFITNLYDIYKDFNKDILISFQHSNTFKPNECEEFKHYVWLKSQIGFTPVWAIKFPKDLSIEEFISILGKPYLIHRPYIFLLDPCLVDVIYIDALKWLSMDRYESKLSFEKRFSVDNHTKMCWGLVKNPPDSSIIKIINNYDLVY